MSVRWNGRLIRVSRRLENGLEKVIATVGNEIGITLLPATPVKTGFTRGNWRPTLNVPSTRPVTFLDPTGQATIARIATVSKSWKVGDTLFIVNNTPYIELLNAGSSPQAPADFVRKAVDASVSRALATFGGGVIRAGR